MKEQLQAENHEFTNLLEETIEETAIKLGKQAEVKIDKIKKGNRNFSSLHLNPFRTRQEAEATKKICING